MQVISHSQEKKKRKCPLELCVTLFWENPDISFLRGFRMVFQTEVGKFKKLPQIQKGGPQVGVPLG